MFWWSIRAPPIYNLCIVHHLCNIIGFEDEIDRDHQTHTHTHTHTTRRKAIANEMIWLHGMFVAPHTQTRLSSLDTIVQSCQENEQEQREGEIPRYHLYLSIYTRLIYTMFSFHTFLFYFSVDDTYKWVNHKPILYNSIGACICLYVFHCICLIHCCVSSSSSNVCV